MRPTIWTSDYTSKTPVSKRLNSYLQHGSENGPLEVWPSTLRLLKIIPLEAWKASIGDLDNLTQAYRMGVLKERIHIEAAWRTYINLCFWLCQFVDDAEQRAVFAHENVSPLVTTFVNKSQDEKWRTTSKGVWKSTPNSDIQNDIHALIDCRIPCAFADLILRDQLVLLSIYKPFQGLWADTSVDFNRVGMPIALTG